MAGINCVFLLGRLTRDPQVRLTPAGAEARFVLGIEYRTRDATGAWHSTPCLTEVLAKSGVEPARARTLLAGLLREKRLARISDDLVFHRAAIDQLRALLAPRKSQRFNVAAFKEWTGVSRKYAIPLLEYLDREHVTRREGDERLVL